MISNIAISHLNLKKTFYLGSFFLFLKGLSVHPHPSLFSDQGSEVQRKTIGVIQQPSCVPYKTVSTFHALGTLICDKTLMCKEVAMSLSYLG